MENNKSDNNVEFNWETETETQKASVSEGFKKILTSGISAVLMSEDGVRQYLQELKLPKDAIGSLIKGVAKSKEEIVTRVGNEFSKLVEKIDLVEEMTKFLRENKIKISAEIEFSKKDKNKKDS
ncbi:hypothetical protein K2X05_03410 [bacterium]|nr:hypothetical protein [bacterium]